MNQRTANCLGAGGVGLVGVVYLIHAWQLPFGAIDAPDIGFLPKVLGWSLLGLAGLALAVMLRRPAPAAPAAPAGGGERRRRAAMAMVVLLIYPLILDWAGFLLTTGVVLYLILRVVEYRTRLASLVVAALTTGLAWLIFAYLLRVQFPRGLWG